MSSASKFRRLSSVMLLAFSSGLPLALVGSTLQLMYTDYGFSLVAIGAITLLGLPYNLKFLWAPVIDRFTPLRLGRRRSWILLTQVAIFLGLLLMALLRPDQHNYLLLATAITVAFFSASQDVSIDAYRTDILLSQERGLGASVNTIGYRLAMLVSGAFAVALAVKTSWAFSYLIMALLILLCMFFTWFAPRPVADRPPQDLRQAIIEPWRDFASRKYALYLVIFILIYKLCDAFALSLSSVFLVRGVGFSLAVVATTTKFVGLVASLLGAVAGGVLYKRLGLWRALFIFGILQTLSNATYLFVALSHKNYFTMSSAVFIEFFCSGVSAVAFVAFLMSLCNHKYTATQYAIFSALSSLGLHVIGPFAGIFAQAYSWPVFYGFSITLGLPALLMLLWLRSRLDFNRLC